MLDERVDVAVEVVGDPARAEAVVGHAARPRCARGSRPGRAAALSPTARRLRSGTVFGVGLERVAEELDREHAGHRAALVHDRPVLRLLGEQVGERVAQHVVQLEHGSARERSSSPTRSPCSARSESQPSGSPLVVHQQRVGHLRVGDLARAPRPPARPTRTSGAFHRSTSRTRWSASRLSARSEPTKSSTNAFAGCIRSSAGGAYWASLPPFCMIAMRSPILIASSMSWVTKTTVLRISRWRRRNSFWSRSRLIGSIAPKGSSISISGGSTASARATPTRWRWPPESWRRVAVARLGRVQAHELEQLVHARADALAVPVEQPRHGGDVVRHRQVREQARSAGSRSRCPVAAPPGWRSRTLWPSSRMSPSVMSIMRFTIRIAVVLPHPDGPTSTQISPAGTVSESSSTAGSL